MHHLEQEITIQKEIAYTAGLLQGDITIRTLIESLAEGVLVINSGGRVVLINRRTEDLFGYDKTEVQGEALDLFIPMRSRENHHKHLAAYFKNPTIRHMGMGMELVGVKKDGSEFPVEVSLSCLHVETGKLGLAFITDISARKAAEKELSLKNKQLDEFAQIVAHDLNSSINHLVGFSELLLSSLCELSDEQQKDYLQEIALSGRKMSSIIRELLLLARMKKEEISVSLVDMHRIVESSLKRLEDDIRKANAKITVNELSSEVISYAPWIEEIWVNYLSNAIKYGGNSPEITIGCTTDASGYTFWVKDNGNGLSQKELSLVFDESQDARRKIIRGNGLGLNIVKSIVEKLDGSVSATSKINEGSIFYFTLPLSINHN